MSGIRISINKGVFSHPQCGAVIPAVIKAADGLSSGFRDVIPMIGERASDPVRRQMVFRFKPQMFAPGVDTAAVLSLALEGLMDRGYGIRALRVFLTDYAVTNNVLENYKGYEYSIYKYGTAAISGFNNIGFFNQMGVRDLSIPVLGAGQAIEMPEIPVDIDNMAAMWTEATDYGLVSKVGPKLSAVLYDFGSGLTAFLNGRIAGSKKRFERPGGLLMAAVCESLNKNSSSWARMRERFLGSSEPLEARSGSLRQILRDRHDDFNLVDDHNQYNGVHLSSCVIETMLEISLWFSVGVKQQKAGQYLRRRGIKGQSLSWLMFNSVTGYGGSNRSVFTHTDCMDVEVATPVIKEILEDRNETDL